MGETEKGRRKVEKMIQDFLRELESDYLDALMGHGGTRQEGNSNQEKSTAKTESKERTGENKCPI